ncbi:ABC transporter permease [Sneathiella chinensis]|uniref:Peptide ABC transporter permease n=1 Tax=Sneathiella chinensis TaxID=349750 RepID=A0ABQ5TZ57_9PROT|nr:ABC transporter permease [Sneathiella chinensis]GLQ05164.1 peptide ABC transporter permease [Sneathiella chinensis]
MTDTTDFRTIPELPAPSPSEVLRQRIFQHRGLMIGGGILAVIVLGALFAPVLAPYDPYLQDLANRTVPPVWMDGGSWAHVLGTDQLGRDYLTRLLYGARISLLIGLATAAISGVIGISLGLIAGYFGGRVDNVIMFLITTRLAMPVILVALAVVALIGSSLTTVILVLGFLLWERFALVIRASTMRLRTLEYVDAAKAQGAGSVWILIRELIPNLANSIIVVATLEMAHAIILEAALSFLGLGIQPPLPSWGLMVSEGRELLLFVPWLITIPGVFLFLLVLSINLVGDGLRDVTAPDGKN